MNKMFIYLLELGYRSYLEKYEKKIMNLKWKEEKYYGNKNRKAY